MKATASESPIALELLRTRVESIAAQAAETVIRTAISPVVNEAKDCGTTITDRDGNLIAGGGVATIHWVCAARAVKATIARYGGEIAAGDVFVANDPYQGGGMHPSDIIIQRPIFAAGERVGWVTLSAHMMDMGGMAVGSWAPHAAECYQEAIRIPPVRLIAGGADVREIWEVLRTNIRFASLVEMDIRSLIAGANVADARLREVVAEYGAERYAASTARLIDLSERVLRDVIASIEPGEYATVAWTEWGDKFVRTPCRLTVAGSTLSFDFAGADAQIPFFINTQPYIIKTLFMPVAMATLGPDLPFNEGLLRPIELRCPEGSVVHSRPPAPINAGHIHLAGTAAEAMYRCLRLAIGASPALAAILAKGAEGYAALASNSWSGMTADGPESWMITDGVMTGGCAFGLRDGTDFAVASLDLPGREQSQPRTFDVETYEAWFPIVMRERRLRTGAYGAGRWRAGAALSFAFEPCGVEQVVGQMLGTRGRLALGGEAGAAPGAVTRIDIVRADGSRQVVSMSASDVVVKAGERFELASASAGGWGDPLERPLAEVAEDLRQRRLSQAEAESAYGIVLDDADATAVRRAALRRARLAQATLPAKIPAPAASAEQQALPLYPGIVQRGDRAYALRSGALLAVAPDHWTDGCAVLESRDADMADGVILRTYLDPTTGAALFAEAVPRGGDRTLAVLPRRWTEAHTRSS